MQTRHLRKIPPGAAGLEHRPGVARGDSLDRALSYLETIMFAQLDPGRGERLIGREIRNGPLQGSRTAARTDLGAINERPHPAVTEPVLRL